MIAKYSQIADQRRRVLVILPKCRKLFATMRNKRFEQSSKHLNINMLFWYIYWHIICSLFCGYRVMISDQVKTSCSEHEGLEDENSKILGPASF